MLNSVETKHINDCENVSLNIKCHLDVDHKTGVPIHHTTEVEGPIIGVLM